MMYTFYNAANIKSLYNSSTEADLYKLPAGLTFPFHVIPVNVPWQFPPPSHLLLFIHAISEEAVNSLANIVNCTGPHILISFVPNLTVAL